MTRDVTRRVRVGHVKHTASRVHVNFHLQRPAPANGREKTLKSALEQHSDLKQNPELVYIVHIDSQRSMRPQTPKRGKMRQQTVSSSQLLGDAEQGRTAS